MRLQRNCVSENRGHVARKIFAVWPLGKVGRLRSRVMVLVVGPCWDWATVFLLGRRWVAPLIKGSIMSKVRSLDTKSADLVADFLARGGQITKCPPRRAHVQSSAGFNSRNDRSRQALGLPNDG